MVCSSENLRELLEEAYLIGQQHERNMAFGTVKKTDCWASFELWRDDQLRKALTGELRYSGRGVTDGTRE